MKVLGLSLLLLCLVATAAAQSSSDPQKGNQVTAQDSRSSGTLLLPHLTRDRALWSEWEPHDWRIPEGVSGTNSYCAYMRTYRMKRESRDSDAVRLAGYTKCVPSNRFETRNAVQIQTEPTPRQ